MAIRVVQGLIDVAQGEQPRAQSSVDAKRAPVPAEQPKPTSQVAQSLNLLQQQQSILRTTAQSVVQDASVTLIRSRSSLSENRIREIDKAQSEAGSLAERISGDDEVALRAHPDLEAGSARHHFSH